MPTKNPKLPGNSSRMNSGKPSSVPTVPGAFGESPVPSPWATRRISRFISAVVEEDFPVFPEIINTGCGGQCDGCPLGNLRHPPRPSVSGDLKREQLPDNTPVTVAVRNQQCDDGDNLGDGLVFALFFGGQDDVFNGGQKA